MFICLCTWLLVTDRLRRSSSTAGHHVLRPDLDWHFTIAHACLVTAFDMCNVPVDGGVTQKKQAAT